MEGLRPEELPREKAKRLGLRALEGHELVALLLGTGSSREDVFSLSRRLLFEAGGLKGLFLEYGDGLGKQHGISLAKAMRLGAAFELGRRIYEEEIRGSGDSSPSALYSKYGRLAYESEEYLYLIGLRNNGRILFEREIGRGSALRIRGNGLLKALLRSGADKAILLHTHPGGSYVPSQEDLLSTSKAEATLGKGGVELIDHVIVSQDGYFSFREEGIVGQK